MFSYDPDGQCIDRENRLSFRCAELYPDQRRRFELANMDDGAFINLYASGDIDGDGVRMSIVAENRDSYDIGGRTFSQDAFLAIFSDALAAHAADMTSSENGHQYVSIGITLMLPAEFAETHGSFIGKAR